MSSIIFVLLGATGDLAKKKLIPALKGIISKRTVDEIRVIAVGRRDFDDNTYLQYIGEDKSKLPKGITIQYFKADFEDDKGLVGLKQHVEKLYSPKSDGIIFYLATIPKHYDRIAEQISFCCAPMEGKFVRIMFEKPFGIDLKSSNLLNKSLHKHLKEEQIYRVDHYLGKDTVQNILVLRLSNPFFERTWNSKFIKNIRITVDEDMGVAERIRYYDTTGAIKDMVQNHLLQVLSFILMTPPSSIDSNDVHTSKMKALKTLMFTDKAILGQYEGYADEAKKIGNKKSTTETFALLSLISKDSRWKGTNIELKTGKFLRNREAFIEIEYAKEPCSIYCNIDTYPNKLILNIQPIQDINFYMNTKTPGRDFDVKQIKLDFCHECEFISGTPESYEVILEECIKGDKTLFIREDELAESWKLVDEIRKRIKDSKPIIYKKGSDGPTWNTSKS